MAYTKRLREDQFERIEAALPRFGGNATLLMPIVVLWNALGRKRVKRKYWSACVVDFCQDS